ncbi:uncharacterized protein LOC110349161 isoform X2 [Heterocephalus glaber]|uniref:Uncharacterized protein LOC110349161 isoform X2 n=1 Tax=Heterocephalus glaber TaxID=10181 RepID=A0AAX6SXU4_HETGA|nr:uncharacterized protein LOC110349161 isoform X2 [Heterocephalus glaber]XP_021114042.1 uncharacterized protein LOC110349161 isoform X2 [Heterocephalus glaber]
MNLTPASSGSSGTWTLDFVWGRQLPLVRGLGGSSHLGGIILTFTGTRVKTAARRKRSFRSAMGNPEQIVSRSPRSPEAELSAPPDSAFQACPLPGRCSVCLGLSSSLTGPEDASSTTKDALLSLPSPTVSSLLHCLPDTPHFEADPQKETGGKVGGKAEHPCFTSTFHRDAPALELASHRLNPFKTTGLWSPHDVHVLTHPWNL